MEFIEAAHHWVGREGQTPKYVVLHGTAGGTTAAGIANYFAQQATEASSNYVVGISGDMVCCVKEEDAPWANGALTAGHAAYWDKLNGINPNLVSIAIEFCKPSLDNSDNITTEQEQAAFPLIKAICQRWEIPTKLADETGGIAYHCSLDPVNRSRCPGTFPLAELLKYLNGEGESMLQVTDLPGWATDSGGGRWHFKSGYDVIGGILDFYRTIRGAPRLPITGEQSEIPGMVYQVFEAGIVVYDPDRSYPGGPGTTDACYLLNHSDPLFQKIYNLSTGDVKIKLQAIENSLTTLTSSL